MWVPICALGIQVAIDQAVKEAVDFLKAKCLVLSHAEQIDTTAEVTRDQVEGGFSSPPSI
jgi:hypothetical protein